MVESRASFYFSFYNHLLGIYCVLGTVPNALCQSSHLFPHIILILQMREVGSEKLNRLPKVTSFSVAGQIHSLGVSAQSPVTLLCYEAFRQG